MTKLLCRHYIFDRRRVPRLSFDVSTLAKSKRLVLGVIGASKLYPEV